MSHTKNDIARFIHSVEQGDEQATTDLWEYCYPRLLRYSRQRLPQRLRRVLDEEDVALSAFKSFCAGANKGTLGEITGSDELWRLLYCIASRKARGYIRNQTAQKRGGGKVSGESVFQNIDDDQSHGIEQVADSGFSPAMKAQFSHDCQRLMDALDDDVLQMIALLRIEGYSCDDIAERVKISKRSVERRLNLIRKIWTTEATSESSST